MRVWKDSALPRLKPVRMTKLFGVQKATSVSTVFRDCPFGDHLVEWIVFGWALQLLFLNLSVFVCDVHVGARTAAGPGHMS